MALMVKILLRKKCLMYKDVKMTITKFKPYTDEELVTYTGTLDNILKQIANYERFYYRITALGKNAGAQSVTDTHFGVTISTVGSLKLTEADYLNNYLNYIIAEHKKGSRRYSFWNVLVRDIKYLEQMELLSRNTEKGFQEALNNFLDDNRGFKEVMDLNLVKGIQGLYFLILDEYNACYIGQSSDIKRRIMQHWSKNDYFKEKGIDMFKAKDTTRIYAFPMSEKEYNRVNIFEYNLVESIPTQYALNILSGGRPNFLIENNLPLFLRYEDDVRTLVEVVNQRTKKIHQNTDKFESMKVFL